MSEAEKREILKRVAALPKEDQRNLAFFVAGMSARATEDNKKSDGTKKREG